MAYFRNYYLDFGDMWRLIAYIAILCSFYTSSIAANDNYKLETRCGWFSNPTPANIWLTDRDGEWIIGAMGGHQADGDWDWPSFREDEWIKTNHTYGYGCACFRLMVNKQTHNVIYIEKSWARPLDTCNSDSSIKIKPE